MASDLDMGTWISNCGLHFGLNLTGYMSSMPAGQMLYVCTTSCNGTLCLFTFLLVALATCFISGCGDVSIASLIAAQCTILLMRRGNGSTSAHVSITSVGADFIAPMMRRLTCLCILPSL